MLVKKSIWVTVIVCFVAVGLLLGGYLVLRAALNASQQDTDQQPVLSSTTPLPPAQTDTLTPQQGSIDLTVITLQDSELGIAPDANLTVNQAAQVMAANVRDVFGVDVEGSTVQIAFVHADLPSTWTVQGPDQGSVTISGDDPSSEVQLAELAAQMAQMEANLMARATWVGQLTTAAGDAFNVTVDALTGNVYRLEHATTGDPRIYQACVAPSKAVLADKAVASVASDFVTAKLTPGQVVSAKPVCVVQDTGAVQVAVVMANTTAYIVAVDTLHVAVGFSFYPNGIPDNFDGFPLK